MIEKIEQFLKYFISSHSWYKHLPFQERVDFIFFLDYEDSEGKNDNSSKWRFAGGRIRGMESPIESITTTDRKGKKIVLSKELV